MATKYATVKQGGEMAYGQPTWLVRLTDDALTPSESGYAHGQELVIATRVIKTTYQVDDEPPVVHTRTERNKLRTYELFVPCKWRKTFNYFAAIDTPKGKGFLFGPLHTMPRNMPKMLDSYKVAAVHPQCFRDVADAANYFGDRLPKDFYDRYADILVPLP